MSKAPDPATGPACLIRSTERVLLDVEVLRRIEQAGDQAEIHRFFARAYGKDKDGDLLEDVLAILETPSLFAPRRLVVVMDGGALVKAPRVQRWLASPAPRTELLLAHRRSSPKDKGPALPKGVRLPILEVPAPRNRSERHQWLSRRLSAHGLTLAKDAVPLLEEHVGESLDALVREVDKLSLYCDGEEQIRAADVEALVGHSAGRDFDRLLAMLLRGSLKGALDLQEAAAREGLRVFGGNPVHGARQTAATFLPIFLSRLRRQMAVGESRGELRERVAKVLRMNPYYVERLAREHQQIGTGRASRWSSAALAAEVSQKRVGNIPEEDLLTLLMAELCREP